MKDFRSRVLALDAHEDNCELLCIYLESAGFECDIAQDGLSALALLKQQKYAAVITTVFLTEISGIDLCRELRRFDSSTPVIIYTGAATVAERTSGFQAGADAYLIKPDDFEDIVPTIISLTQKAQTPSAIRTSSQEPSESFV